MRAFVLPGSIFRPAAYSDDKRRGRRMQDGRVLSDGSIAAELAGSAAYGHSLTVTPMGEAEETRDAVEELLQHTLGVSPVWDVPGGENTP